jgi:DME family drug/metabolite transporter
LNTSQTALAAAAGVLWFAEPLTAGLIIGTALTVAGLLLMENRRAQRRMEDGR